MKKIAIFASGNGSNFQAIVDAVKSGDLKAEISLLICDKPEAYCVKRAEKENIPCFTFYPKEFQNKEAYEQVILKKLEEYEIDFIALAGYMRLVGPTLLNQFEGKIVNIHPSLLPAFPGKDAVGQALAAGVTKTGVTVHFVDEGMDTGQVIEQRSVDIDEGETHESLQQKIQRVEHQLFPDVLNKLLNS